MTQPHSSENKPGPSQSAPAAYQLIPIAGYQAEAGALDMRELFGTLWQKKLLVGAITGFCTVLAVAAALLMQPVYRAEALLLPVTDGSSRSLGQFAGQFGVLAQLAGPAFSATGETAAALATLESRALIETFIEENKLLPVLFSPRWDEHGRSWLISDPSEIPTLHDGYDQFRKILTVVEQKKTGLVKVMIDWRDPGLAAVWVNDLVTRANRMLRDRAIQESEQHLDYLNAELGKTSVSELRQSLFSLIEAELKRAMLAKGNDQYAFKVLDPAIVPNKRHSPKRRQIVVIGFAVGLLLGTGFVLTRKALPQAR
jgi:uncharacterized protein involved in exopolysaccharide biosynthesis